MSFEAEFLTLMPSTITVATQASRAADGHVTYSTATSTYRCRIVKANQNIRGADGTWVMVGWIAWVASTGYLSVQDKYTLPDGTSPPVLAIETITDEDGPHHNKVFFGSKQVRLR